MLLAVDRGGEGSQFADGGVACSAKRDPSPISVRTSNRVI
jgi:hypothetical protein